jgi:hypothetical protein
VNASDDQDWGVSPPESRKPRRALSGAEFDAALSKAEDLLTDCDRARNRNLIVAVFVLGVWTLAAAPVAASRAVGVVALLVCVVVALVTGAGAVVVALRGHDNRVRDERAMLELVGLLREMLPRVAEAEGWSSVRYRLVEARIARFPIGPRRRR